MFTKFKIDGAELSAMTDQTRARFLANNKPGTFEEFAAGVIRDRLKRNPMQYLEFGPYWWAVKAILRDSWPQLSDGGDAAMAAQYCGKNSAETMVAAEAFKDSYRMTYFVGANTFRLDEEGPDYVLEDADMMRLAAQRKAV